VLDRRGLEDAACEDYRQTVDEYEATFEPRNYAEARLYGA